MNKLHTLREIYSSSELSDEKNERIKYFLKIILFIIFCAGILISFIALFSGWFRTLGTVMTVTILIIFSIYFLKKGYIRFASVFTVLLLLGGVSFMAYNGDGIHDTGVVALPVIILLSSLLFEKTGFIFFSGLSIVSLGIVHILRASYIQDFRFDHEYTMEYITLVVIFSITAIIFRLLTNSLIFNLKKVRENAIKYQNIFKNIQDIYFESGPDSTILELSPSCEILLGFTRSELLGKPLSLLCRFDDDCINFLKKIKENCFVSNYEIKIKNKKNDVRTVTINATLVTGNEDQPHKIIGSIRDISDQKELEDQLVQAQKMESIGKLVGGIAHDFNNLLTVINGNSELALLHLKKGTTDLERELNAISMAGSKAADLTRHLLTFSRKQFFQPRIVNINQLILNLKEMIFRLLGEDINIDLDLDSDIPSIKADPSQIEQILINLLINARDAVQKKHSRGTGKKIGIETRSGNCPHEKRNKKAESGECIILSINDNGIGIREEIKQKIFEPFFTTKSHGSGFGLSTVYGIVKQNNGFIDVQSVYEEGCRFNIYWPVCEQPAGIKNASNKKDIVIGNEKVMVVEDEDTVRRIAVDALETYGYNVWEASNGKEALSLFNRHNNSFDLLISDLIMPKMGGRELMEKIRIKHPDLKILFISGYAHDDIFQDIMSGRMINFLQKPYTINDLIAKVREILDS